MSVVASLSRRLQFVCSVCGCRHPVVKSNPHSNHCFLLPSRHPTTIAVFHNQSLFLPVLHLLPLVWMARFNFTRNTIPTAPNVGLLCRWIDPIVGNRCCIVHLFDMEKERKSHSSLSLLCGGHRNSGGKNNTRRGVNFPRSLFTQGSQLLALLLLVSLSH